jgi:hypothetical protein
MWFECTQCIASFNSPRGAADHEEKTGHRVVFDSYDWTDNEEEVY